MYTENINMKVFKHKLLEDSDQGLVWSKIIFKSNDDKESYVYFCAPRSYISNRKTPKSEKEWVNHIVTKWKSLSSEIFNHKSHFDVYTHDSDKETEYLNFLIKKSHHVPSFF